MKTKFEASKIYKSFSRQFQANPIKLLPGYTLRFNKILKTLQLKSFKHINQDKSCVNSTHKIPGNLQSVNYLLRVF